MPKGLLIALRAAVVLLSTCCAGCYTPVLAVKPGVGPLVLPDEEWGAVKEVLVLACDRDALQALGHPRYVQSRPFHYRVLEPLPDESYKSDAAFAWGAVGIGGMDSKTVGAASPAKPLIVVISGHDKYGVFDPLELEDRPTNPAWPPTNRGRAAPHQATRLAGATTGSNEQEGNVAQRVGRELVVADPLASGMLTTDAFTGFLLCDMLSYGCRTRRWNPSGISTQDAQRVADFLSENPDCFSATTVVLGRRLRDACAAKPPGLYFYIEMRAEYLENREPRLAWIGRRTEEFSAEGLYFLDLMEEIEVERTRRAVANALRRASQSAAD